VEVRHRELAQRRVDGLAIAQPRAVALRQRAPVAATGDTARARAGCRAARSRDASRAQARRGIASAHAATSAPSMQCATR
jgi:hypothetical protein